MEGQRDIFEVLREFSPAEEGDFDSFRKCEYCCYYRMDAIKQEKHCVMNLQYTDKCFRPNAFIIPGLCGSCGSANRFCKEKHFCTGTEANRHSAFQDKVRTWNAWNDNAELDTCDNWKKTSGR